MRTRPVWIRDLRIYHALDDVGAAPGPAGAGAPRARSRFRSLSDPQRIAEYAVREAAARHADDVPLLAAETHTLAVVREFRRVPLDASGLALMLFTARPGCAARAVATLAHWAEGAVSAYQPAYLLLARSLDQPGVSTLIAGVRERRALQGASRSPLGVEGLMPELAPLLALEPEVYGYFPDGALVPRAVSPYAV